MVDVKVVLFGDGAVGKTSIARRYTGKGFSEKYKKTIGVNFHVQERTYEDSNLGRVKFHWLIWDLAGEPSFEQVRSDYYNGAKAGIAVYDICRTETYHNLPNWIEEFWTHTRGLYPLILVGNKKDLREQGRAKVPTSTGRQYAKSLGESIGRPVPFIETSAKEGENINAVFDTLANQILRWIKRKVKRK